MIGRSIGNYKILERLSFHEGIGVYKAVDLLLGRNVVVKTLEGEGSTRTEIAEAFRHEAAVLAKLDHKSISRLYSLTEVGDDLFMIAEFSDGETLDRVLLRDRKLSFEKTVAVFSQVLECVEYTHKNGVAHGSLDTSKIMLTDDGKVKISGYGNSYINSTQTANNASDKELDLHALAAMIYESLTGKKSFASAENSTRNIPNPVESVVKRALPNATGKYQTVAQFRTALSEVGFSQANGKVETAVEKQAENPPKTASKNGKPKPENKFIIIEPIDVPENEKVFTIKENKPQAINLKSLKGKNRKAFSAKKAGQKRYVFGAAAILAVLIFHSFWQFSYIQSESLRTAEEIVKTDEPEQVPTVAKLPEPFVEAATEVEKVEAKPITESKKSDIVAAEKNIPSERTVQRTNYRQNEVKPVPKSVVEPPVVKKKAAPESKGERLRRAEKLLTGM